MEAHNHVFPEGRWYNRYGPWGRNKDLKRRIAGLEQVIDAHQLKIRQELMKSSPDEEVIAGWKAEIEGHRKAIQKLIWRLKREW